MRVLFISSGNLSDGKPSILIKNQGESLKSIGIHVHYYTINGKGVYGYLKAVKKIAKEISSIQPDHIHSHYSLSAFATSIALIIYNIKKTHIVSLMGSDTKMKGWKRRLTIYLSNQRWNHTIVKALSMAKELNLKDYKIIPNGVDMNNIKPSNSTFNTTVVFPANPQRVSKNFDLAVQAMNIAKNSIPELNLEICYNVSHQEIISKIQKSGIVLVTSLWEGSPNIVKEAMALNKPIVCTKVGDTEMLLNNVNGSFLVSFDPYEVAEGIKSAVRFGKNEEESNGRKKLLELKLDSNSIAERLLKIYNS